MKYAKSAAVVAGSVIALGAGSPAFAMPVPNMSLNGGINDLTSQLNQKLDGHELTPLVDLVTGTVEKSKLAPKKLLGGATGATKKLPLLGGLPLGK